MLYQKPFKFNTDYNREKQTFLNQYDEAVQLYGEDLVWINTSLNIPEYAFGEYLGKVITEGTDITLFIEQIATDFVPEDAAMYSKFGFVPNVGEMTLYGTIQYFQEHDIVPKQQDIIYYKKQKKLFEVTHVQESREKYRITALLYNYDNIKVEDSVSEEEIKSLNDIADLQSELENTRIEELVVTEDITPDEVDDLEDGLY